MRGEHRIERARNAVGYGSSPRARGTPDYFRGDSRAWRIIPACAGNTLRPSSSAGTAADHPRVRGEHHHLRGRIGRRCGSSPRARGTRAVDYLYALIPRIIPACAGNTCGRTPSIRGRTDHPRVRGEHRRIVVSSATAAGSSPRARGTPTNPPSRPSPGRIIPACAGNTRPPGPCQSIGSDHPRVRGEHASKHLLDADTRGSSPRARGTLHAQQVKVAVRRIIPACAGNTAALLVRPWPYPDHPRVRGEHPSISKLISRCTGSSPRARGTPAAQRLALGLSRIIPACAGNT